MTTSVNNLSSNKLGGIPLKTDTGPVKESTLKRSDSQKSLSGPDGLQGNSQSKQQLDGSLRPRSNINDLRKNALIKQHKQEQTAEAAAARNNSMRARDGKVSAEEKTSFLNALNGNSLFNKMKEKNSGNEDAIITNESAPSEQLPTEGKEVPPNGPPTPPPPPPLPFKPGKTSQEVIKLDVDAPPLSDSDSDSDAELELDIDAHINIASGDHGIQEQIEVYMDGPPPSESDSDNERDLDVDVHIHGGPGGNHGVHEELQADEKTQRLIRMQEQQEANSNALTELNVRIQEQAAIRDVITKMAEANRKTIEAAAKAMVDAAPK